MIFLRIMLKQATKDINDEDAVYICHCLHSACSTFGQYLLIQNMEQLIHSLFFADDAAILLAQKEHYSDWHLALQRLPGSLGLQVA